MRISLKNELHPACSGKDIALYIITRIGTAGGTGYAIEFAGSPITELSMEGRMSLCNMAIEAGARSGMVAVDETTLKYVRGRPFSPTGHTLTQAETAWCELYSDHDAKFDREYLFDARDISPQVTWGTSPEMCVGVTDHIPMLDEAQDDVQRESWKAALKYMGLNEGTPIQDIEIDSVFIGSCTNSRIEDLRCAAAIVMNMQIAPNIKQALIVPGSGLIKKQAEAEGLDQIFKDAGFEWREPGCSMCLAMNADRLAEGERCASTSNRNFEGRQGKGGRTHLVSPATAAAAAIAGHFIDIR